MNQIVNINTASTLTMSSREIAKITGKRHDHVLADIRKMIGSLGLTPPEFSGNLPDRYGRSQFVFNLPKRETLILISGYSVELRARIIDRWMELEAQVATKSGRVTATEVTAMLTQYVTDTQEKIVAPLVQAIADLIRNQAPQAAPALTIAGWNLRKRRPQQ
jgi:phage regulator Rha-like protein